MICLDMVNTNSHLITMTTEEKIKDIALDALNKMQEAYLDILQTQPELDLDQSTLLNFRDAISLWEDAFGDL